MKLLLITLEYPPFHGGVATYLKTLIDNAPSEITVVVDEPKNEHWLKTAWRLMGKVHKEKYDLVAVSHVLPIGYVAWILKTIFRVPYLVINHGTETLLASLIPWKRFWMRFVLRRAKFVIAVSQFTVGLLKKEGITNVHIITPCLPTTSPLPRQGRGEPSPYKGEGVKGKNILSIGRLVPRKGFDTMIRAMPEVLKTIPDAQYTIVGTGSEKDNLLKLITDLHIEQSVSLRGEVADKQPYFENAAVFVLPARNVDDCVEGFGIVSIEAASYGLPVVVGRSGGAPETVRDGETGLVVEPDNVAGYAAAVIRLLKNSDEAAKMGAAGRTFVTDEFSCERITKNFWKIVHA